MFLSDIPKVGKEVHPQAKSEHITANVFTNFESNLISLLKDFITLKYEIEESLLLNLKVKQLIKEIKATLVEKSLSINPKEKFSE